MPLAEVGLFHEIAFVLLAAVLAGVGALWLGQPLVSFFIAAGIVAGPSGLGLVDASDELDLLATIGIALLLFVVGLKLDVRLLRAVGPGVLAVGVVQMALTGGAGYALAAAFGLGPLESLYLALGVALSSTVVVVKLLSDREEIDQLHGRLAVGILILQDLAVIVAMIALTAYGEGGGLARELGEVVLQGIVFLAVIAAVTRWVLPSLLHRLAQAQELLVLFAIAWALALAATADLLGLSQEVGAFVAGVSLASSFYRGVIDARLTSVRDFLLLFFFINLGATLDLRAVDAELVVLAAACAVLVLALKPAVTTVPLVLLGYHSRPSLRAGLALAQVSEFSLILAALGLSLGHVDRELVTLLTLVAVVTITVSTYLVGSSARIVRRLGPRLGRLERAAVRVDDDGEPAPAPEVVVVGLGRYGGGIVERALLAGHEVLGVELDPGRLAELRERGIHVVYGDAEDPDLPKRLPLESVRWVISTLRRPQADVALTHALRRHGFRGRIAVSAHRPEDVALLSQAGADELLRPFEDAATAASDTIFGRSQTASAKSP